MEHELQQLLDKLLRDGVEKGQETAASIMDEAKKKAEKLIREAEQEAREIRREAGLKAEEMKRNVTSELKLSASQTISALKQQIQTLILKKAVSEPLTSAFSDPDFMKGIIESLVKKWDPKDTGLTLMMPQSASEVWKRYLDHTTDKVLKEGLQIVSDAGLESGFRIGPSDGRYLISFTDRDFETFFMDFLRPLSKELLYGKTE